MLLGPPLLGPRLRPVGALGVDNPLGQRRPGGEDDSQRNASASWMRCAGTPCRRLASTITSRTRLYTIANAVNSLATPSSVWLGSTSLFRVVFRWARSVLTGQRCRSPTLPAE
jgi:hypothetical protein